jgi:hypothetical protein
MKRWVVIATASAAWLAGCNLILPLAMMQEHKRTIPPEYAKLDGKRAMVLVWAEPETLFDYPHVRLELATYVRDKIRAKLSDVTFVEPVRVEDHLQRSLDADADPVRIGRQFNAQIVVYIELLEFQIRDPEVPDLVQARIRASVAVHDLTADPDEAAFQELTPVLVTEPEGPPVLITRANVTQIRQAAYVKFAEMVARKFYSWEEVMK